MALISGVLVVASARWLLSVAVIDDVAAERVGQLAELVADSALQEVQAVVRATANDPAQAVFGLLRRRLEQDPDAGFGLAPVAVPATRLLMRRPPFAAHRFAIAVDPPRVIRRALLDPGRSGGYNEHRGVLAYRIRVRASGVRPRVERTLVATQEYKVAVAALSPPFDQVCAFLGDASALAYVRPAWARAAGSVRGSDLEPGAARPDGMLRIVDGEDAAILRSDMDRLSPGSLRRRAFFRIDEADAGGDIDRAFRRLREDLARETGSDAPAVIVWVENPTAVLDLTGLPPVSGRLLIAASGSVRVADLHRATPADHVSVVCHGELIVSGSMTGGLVAMGTCRIEGRPVIRGTLVLARPGDARSLADLTIRHDPHMAMGVLAAGRYAYDDRAYQVAIAPGLASREMRRAAGR
jgi:hypothetical protein